MPDFFVVRLIFRRVILYRKRKQDENVNRILAEIICFFGSEINRIRHFRKSQSATEKSKQDSKKIL